MKKNIGNLESRIFILFLFFIYFALPISGYASDCQCSAQDSGNPYLSPARPPQTPAEPVNQGPGLMPVDKIPYDPNGSLYECLANNPNCLVFYAISSDPRVAQDRAMDTCFRTPPSLCRPLGCHRLP